MILFKPEHIRLIQQGLKTQTRRIWKKPHCKIGSIQRVKSEMLSKDYHAEIFIIDIHQEKLLDISNRDAWFEGCYTRKEFLQKWDEINPCYPSISNPEVFVVSFNLVKNFQRGLI